MRLDSGEELDADMLVAGKGIAANIDFVDWSQIDVDEGILVDEQMRTSVPTSTPPATLPRRQTASAVRAS